MADLANLTAIVKTFERPRSLDRLVRSIRRFYPQLPIIVGDDSFRPYPREDVTYARLPADCGAAAGRNALMERVTTPYFLMLDDDFVFTPQTRIELLVESLERHNVALVAGELVRCKRKFYVWKKQRRQNYQAVIERSGGSVRFRRGYHRDLGDAFECDLVLQFFVARTDVFRQIGGWWSELKSDDHEELFLRLQATGLRVLNRPDVTAEHWQAWPRRYRDFRRRDYVPLVAKRHGLTRIEYPNGRVREFPRDPKMAEIEVRIVAERGQAAARS